MPKPRSLKVGRAYAHKNPWAPGMVECAFVVDLGEWCQEGEYYAPCERTSKSRILTAVALKRDGKWVPRLVQTRYLKPWKETMSTSKAKKAASVRKKLENRETRIDRVESELQRRGLINYRLHWSGVTLTNREGVVLSLDTVEKMMEENPSLPPRELVEVPTVPDTDPPPGLKAARQLLGVS